MIKRLSALALLLPLAVGCSGGDDRTEVRTELPTPTASAQATASASPSASPFVGSPLVGTVTPASYAAYGGAWFETPSRRIACQVLSELVSCELREKPTWDVPAWEGPCDVDLVPSVELKGTAPGRAFTSCQGDTASGGPVLDYGTTVTAGVISGTSEKTGLTCRNTATEHGFTISQAAFRGF